VLERSLDSMSVMSDALSRLKWVVNKKVPCHWSIDSRTQLDDGGSCTLYINIVVIGWSNAITELLIHFVSDYGAIQSVFRLH